MAEKDEALYIRNGRPNRVVFHFNGVRYLLEHRGNRQDSVALPPEARQDGNISRWLQIKQLEKISKESFMRLGARTVDVLPNEYVKARIRKPQGGTGTVAMEPADADTTRSKTQLNDRDIHKQVKTNLSQEWGGDLMSTDEELETLEFTEGHNAYPSKHRDSDARRQMGY